MRAYSGRTDPSSWADQPPSHLSVWRRLSPDLVASSACQWRPEQRREKCPTSCEHHLIHRVCADVNVHPDLSLQDLAVVMDPFRFISTKVQDNIKLLRLVDNLDEVRALPHRVDVAVRGILVRSAGRLVVPVTLDCHHMRPYPRVRVPVPASSRRHHDVKVLSLDEAGEDGRANVAVATEGENFDFVPWSGQAGGHTHQHCPHPRRQHHWNFRTWRGLSGKRGGQWLEGPCEVWEVGTASSN